MGKDKLLRKYNNALTIGIIVIAILLIIQRVFCISSVSGNSMKPTLNNGNIITANRFYKNINRNDIILFYPDGKGFFKDVYIKRVVGIPGDKIQIIDGYLYINDIKQETEFKKMIDGGIANEPIYINDNEYFVLGDNRNNSKDSRVLGVINKKSIIGVVN